MLSMVLRHEALSTSPEARAARHRIEGLFQNRPSFDFLTGNDNLWEPLQKLRDELAAREGSVVTARAYNTFAFPDPADAVSMTSTTIDPSLFGMIDRDYPGLEVWENGAVTNSFDLEAYGERL